MCLFEDETIETKSCTKCNEELTLDNYGPSSGGVYLRSECKKCLAIEKRIVRNLKKIYKTPPKNYSCPICNRTESEVQGEGGRGRSGWCLDHCHKTKKFRGWLCHKCNRAIGNLNDDIGLMKRAVEYLQKEYDEDTNQTLL